MRSKPLDYTEAARLALEVFPKTELRKPITLALQQTAQEEGYAAGTFRKMFYAWQKAMVSCPPDGGISSILHSNDRSKVFTKTLLQPLKEIRRRCCTVYSYESFVMAHADANPGPKCKENKLRQLYSLYRYLSERPIVFHWDSIAEHVAILPMYQGKKASAIMDDLFQLYKMGVLIITPPLELG